MDERGSAPLEFLLAGLIILAPLVYVIVALAAVQNVSLGAEATARFVARSIASGSAVPPELVRDSIADSYGLDAASLQISIECVPASAGCPEAGSVVTVTVSEQVSLPLVPDVLGLADAMSVPVDAASTYRVARLAEAP